MAKKSSKEETPSTQPAATSVDSVADKNVPATEISPKAPDKSETQKPDPNTGSKKAPIKPAATVKKTVPKPIQKTAAVAQNKTAVGQQQPAKSAVAKETASTVKSNAVVSKQATEPKSAAVEMEKPPATEKPLVSDTENTKAVADSKPVASTVAGNIEKDKSHSGNSRNSKAADKPVSQKQTYSEPETPLSYAKPVVEEVRSVNPPIEKKAPARHEPDEEHWSEPVHYEEPIGPQYPSMFIVQIAPELAPLAKVGGLADVVTGLSRELELRGNSVEIILPKYDSMRYDHIWGLCKTFDDLWVPWYGGQVHCTVWFGFVHGRKCFFIEPHSQDNFFSRGSIYGFDDDILRFAFFSRAAVEFLLKSGKQPDVIHCHDWQTALVPVYLYEIYQHMGMTHPRVCFTIHNFKHQGVTGDFLLNATGLKRPDYYFHPDRLLDNHTPHAINLMKGGIVYSNFVTTVSPRYAGETKDGGQGFGLESTLHAHHYKYGGIVNGIDYDSWNPEIDPFIPVQYNADRVDGKYDNKRALRSRLLLADSEKPIVAFVGRLDPQKGLDLVRHALFYALNNAAQFVLLGSSPESEINSYFWELKRHLNDSPDCHIEVGFDEELARLIYAGSDMMVVPSLFEPCGLTQLISMKYGTIPVVRAVGGLADTVFDKDNAHDKALHERNGYVFKDYNNAGLESALSRAISCYYEYPQHFRDLIQNAMRYDYSWKNAGQHYLNIYDYIRNK